jgi:hypothetical protein
MHRSKGGNSMKNRWKLSVVAILYLTGVLLQGCTPLIIPPSRGELEREKRFSYMKYAIALERWVFRYDPSLRAGKSIGLRLGVEKFADKRPEKDRLTTRNIADVDEKVTGRLLEDFQAWQIFSAIDFPLQKDKDDLIMSGEIKRFYWKFSESPIKFIPPINLLILFGIPMYYVDGIIELQVRLVSFKTGEIVAEYDKRSAKRETYNLYTRDNMDYPGVELAEALRDVSEQIKEAIVSDIKEGRLRMPQ